MAAFLDDITPFYGTGGKNEEGKDLETFLEGYDPKVYDNPSLTVDTLVFRYKKDFTCINKGLKLLMIKRRNHPSIGLWALPGGFVDIREDVELAAIRELEEETGVTGIPVIQLYTWGEAWRDPRARIVTVSYLAMVEEDLPVKAGDDAAEALWFDVILNQKEGRCAFDLVLSNKEEGVEIQCEIEVIEKTYGILKAKKYKIQKGQGMAFDHGRFILQALLYIEEQLTKTSCP